MELKYLDLPCPLQNTPDTFRRLFAPPGLPRSQSFIDELVALDQKRSRLSVLTQLTRIRTFYGFKHVLENMSVAMKNAYQSLSVDPKSSNFSGIVELSSATSSPPSSERVCIYLTIATEATEYAKDLKKMEAGLWEEARLLKNHNLVGLSAILEPSALSIPTGQPTTTATTTVLSSPSSSSSQPAMHAPGQGGGKNAPEFVGTAFYSRQDPLRQNITPPSCPGQSSSSPLDRHHSRSTENDKQRRRKTRHKQNIGFGWSPSVHFNSHYEECLREGTLGEYLFHCDLLAEMYLARVVSAVSLYNHATALAEGVCYPVSVGSTGIPLTSPLGTRVKRAEKLYEAAESLIFQLSYVKKNISLRLRSLMCQEARSATLAALKCLCVAGRSRAQLSVLQRREANDPAILKGEQDVYSVHRSILDLSYTDTLNLLDRLYNSTYCIVECYTSAAMHLTTDVKSRRNTLLALQCKMAKRYFSGLCLRYLAESTYSRGRIQASKSDFPPARAEDGLYAAHQLLMNAFYQLDIVIQIDEEVTGGSSKLGGVVSTELRNNILIPLYDQLLLRLSKSPDNYGDLIPTRGTAPRTATFVQQCFYGNSLKAFKESILQGILLLGR